MQGFFKRQWKRFSALSRRTKTIVVIVLIVLIAALLVVLRGNHSASSSNALPTVTLESISDIGGNTNGVSVLGTVQSVSEADISAQSGGTVESIHTTLGATVPAGFVIANLDSSSASAAVLQAQGGYDAALAAAKAVTLQAQNTTASLPVAQTTVRNTYLSSYTTAQSTLTTQVDQLFGANGPLGPELLINPLTTGNTLPEERRSIQEVMATWQGTLATANTTDPLTLLTTAQSNLNTISVFLTALSNLASTQGSAATPAQLSAVASAQASINGLIASVSSAGTAYAAAETAAAVSQTQTSNSTGQEVTSAQANVEEALGGLRAAQAAYEKTVVRAPIEGTVNYLPIHVGDNVTQNQHVATVARNNALEVVMQLSEGDRDRIAVGDTLTIENTYKGVVTTIAPALDPTTQQIEVDIAVNDGDGANLVNGQSVQVALPSLTASDSSIASSTPNALRATASSSASTIELPLAAVKLQPNERDVFTVDSTGHLVAHIVTIGQVIGDRIQILTALDPSLDIVLDARGLSAGDAVLIASSTPTSGS
jgi:multidrug efflux pump subunit AcrA (membrane-fusion protein)